MDTFYVNIPETMFCYVYKFVDSTNDDLLEYKYDELKLLCSKNDLIFFVRLIYKRDVDFI